MSIASRIQEIETHIGDVYDTINYSYDTTGVNKNIINIPKYLKKGYIDIINNGTDNLYNNFPKVSGIGSNLSLTPTYEAPIKLNEIQGNTLQDETPTPSSPVPIQSVTGLQNVTISNADDTQSNTYEVNLGKNLLQNQATDTTSNGITYTIDDKGGITANDTATALSYILPQTQQQSPLYEAGTYTFSLLNDMTNKGYTRFEFYKEDKTTRLTRDDIINGSTTITLSEKGYLRVSYIINNGVTVNNFYNMIQVEKGSTASEVNPYFTPIELNKIGTYQDSIKKSTGKNLFDKSTATILDLYIDGSTIKESSYNKMLYIPCEPNTTYTIQKKSSPNSRQIAYTTELPALNVSVYGVIDIPANGTIGTITTGSDAKYLICRFYQTTQDSNTPLQQMLDSIMINEGSTALPYEPYGKVWYEEKQIGKVVLNGSTGSYSNPSTNRFNIDNLITDFKKSEGYNLSLSNYYKSFNQVGTNADFNTLVSNENYAFDFSSATSYTLRFKDTRYTNVNDFKAWLGTNNVSIIYVLNTPTYTEITNTELINQLETLYTAKSQEGTTNISITSEDLEMILNVSALKGEE